MIRLFHVYYPARTLLLLSCEAMIIGCSFLAATLVVLGPDSYSALAYESGTSKILAITAMALLCSYYCDLYAPQKLSSGSEIYFRVLIVLFLLSFCLAGLALFFPEFEIGGNVFLVGLIILAVALLLWRSAYTWLIRKPLLRRRVYVLGSGRQAEHVVDLIRSRRDLGMELVGSAAAIGNDSPTREDLAGVLSGMGRHPSRPDMIVVAVSDRRGTTPVRELLDLRLNGTKVEDACSLLEKVTGKIELEGLHPSALIFSDGFQFARPAVLVRQVLSFVLAALGILITLPVMPLIALAVKLTSPGPALFRQERVGRKGLVFTLCKFRTMCSNAEAGTGAVWAGRNDPRVTRVGRFLRKTRLDELPQLWNVLKGDMSLVGPRPERPEFVGLLQEQIPYYELRHVIRPGLTGWAQVRYQYGASLEDSKEKLQYDLYYIKHASFALDLLIVFETVKTVILGRGAQ